MDNLPNTTPMNEVEQYNWILKATEQKTCYVCSLAPAFLFIAVDFVGAYYNLMLNGIWITMQMFLAFIYVNSTNKYISKLMFGLLFVLLFRCVYLKTLGY